MVSARSRRFAIAMLAMSLTTAACGLKQDALNSLKQANANGGSNEDTGAAPGTTATGPGGTPIPGAPGSSTGPGTVPGSGTGTGTGNGTGTGTDPGSGTGVPPLTQEQQDLAKRPKCSVPTGGNTTGITSTTINIGVHAPQTGTGAPLPPSFKDGVQVYWDQPEHKICGRHVVIDFQDDQYTPKTARDVCGPMSRRDFIVIGGAGTDQIQSCATMPEIAGKHVPYISAGVTTNGLTGLDHYFAVSLTYAEQGDLVVRNAELRGFAHPSAAGGKWAVVTAKSPNFDDATKGIQDALRRKGIAFDTVRVDQTNDSGYQSRAQSAGASLASKGYGTVFVDMAPGFFVYMAGAASTQGYNPQYTGPGITMTEVTVAQLLCSGTHSTGAVQNIHGNFLAPYPGIDRATDDFKTATHGSYDDIYWTLWGLSQLLEQSLNDASSNLTRENFIATMKNAQLPGGVFSPAAFHNSHFGGTGVYSQVINCAKSEPNQKGQPGAWDTVGGRLAR
jgi:hypothetical protein